MTPLAPWITRPRYDRAVMEDLLLKKLPGTAALCIALALTGCDTLSSDFQDLVDQITPPSPAKAGELATDFADPENQQQGLTLLGTATWGGEEEPEFDSTWPCDNCTFSKYPRAQLA